MTTAAVVVAALTAIAWIWWGVQRWLDLSGGSTGTEDVSPRGGSEPPGPERPAVASLLVVGLSGGACRVAGSAATATVVDLAARGSLTLREDPSDAASVLVVTRPAAEQDASPTPDSPTDSTADPGPDSTSDGLEPHERIVIRLLRSRSRDGLVSTGTLLRNQPSWLWWFRFRRAVAGAARRDGLTVAARDERLVGAPAVVALPAVVWMLTQLLSVIGSRSLDGVSVDTIVLGLIGLALVRTVLADLADPVDHLTATGREHALSWMAIRSDLSVRIPDDTSPVTSSARQRALAVAVATGAHESTRWALPIMDPVQPRRVWSDAGDRPRVVTVHSPLIPGRGGRPPVVAAVGLAAIIGSRIAGGIVDDVRGSDRLSELDRLVPDANRWIDVVVDAIGWALWVPLVLGLWLLASGVVDSFISRTRRGLVVDVRLVDEGPGRASWLRSLAGVGRDGAALVEVAVDDGAQPWLNSWLVTTRIAPPVGAEVEVRHTPLLGRVHSMRPIGRSGAAADPGDPRLGRLPA